MSSTSSASNNGQVTEGGFDYECTLRDDTRYIFIKEVNCAQAVPGQKPTNSEEICAKRSNVDLQRPLPIHRCAELPKLLHLLEREKDKD